MPSAACVFGCGEGNPGRYFPAPPRASPPLLRGLGCEASTWTASKAAAASSAQGGGGGGGAGARAPLGAPAERC